MDKYMKAVILLCLCVQVLGFGTGRRRNIPGLMFWPRPDIHNIRLSLLRIKVDDPSTYREHVRRLQNNLQSEYVTGPMESGSERDNVYDCDQFSLRPDSIPRDAVCKFDITSLDPCNSRDNFGYDKGEPCIILRLGRLLGWKPKNYAQTKVECYGRNRTDRQNIASISYYPSQFIDSKYFPFLNQIHYMSPSVAVKFNGLSRGELVMVECKATVGTGTSDVGKITFELLME